MESSQCTLPAADLHVRYLQEEVRPSMSKGSACKKLGLIKTLRGSKMHWICLCGFQTPWLIHMSHVIPSGQ